MSVPQGLPDGSLQLRRGSQQRVVGGGRQRFTSSSDSKTVRGMRWREGVTTQIKRLIKPSMWRHNVGGWRGVLLFSAALMRRNPWYATASEESECLVEKCRWKTQTQIIPYILKINLLICFQEENLLTKIMSVVIWELCYSPWMKMKSDVEIFRTDVLDSSPMLRQGRYSNDCRQDHFLSYHANWRALTALMVPLSPEHKL